MYISRHQHTRHQHAYVVIEAGIVIIKHMVNIKHGQHMVNMKQGLESLILP